MGRGRGSRKDNALPEYVYRLKAKDRVVWREYLGKGRFGKSIRLKGENGEPLTASASHQAILAAYARQVVQARPVQTLRWLLDLYLQSVKFRSLTPATQKGYRIHAESICSHAMRSGKTFGDVPLAKLSPPVWARYRDNRAETPIAANRELQFARAVFSWAVEQGHAEANPVKGVRLFKSQTRDRYIEDWEFDLVQKLANDRTAVMMELAYLLRARRKEVLALRRENIGEDGVYLCRGKGSENEVTRWTPRLQDAVKAAQALHRDVISPWLIHDRQGQPIKASAQDTAWQRLMDKALANGLKERFTFHDIKAKGVTDHAEQWAGHKSERMREVYVRKPREIDATR